MKKKKVLVVGSGAWGTALANVFADAGSDTLIWGRDAHIVDTINNNHENQKYLKGVKLSPELKATSDLTTSLKNTDIVVCAIPTQQIRSVFKPLAPLIGNKHIVNTSKGIEQGSHERVSQLFKEICPNATYTILSGPSFALETAMCLPTAVTLASKKMEDAVEIQELTRTPYFRGYTSTDVVGVEYAGALKNVIAIASGIVTGLKLGYNAQAAVINRGIAEIMRLAKQDKSDPLTFLGLAGTGDLILTCTGPLSRNRKFGQLLGEGKSIPEIQKELGGVAEGYYTAQSAFELAQIKKIDMPITEEMYKILYKGSTPKQALKELMSRELREEGT